MAVIAVACDEGFTARTKECISLVLDAEIPVAFVFTKWDLIQKKDDASSVEELMKEVGQFSGFVGAVTSSVGGRESLDAVKALLARWRVSIEDSGSNPIRSNGYVLHIISKTSHGALTLTFILFSLGMQVCKWLRFRQLRRSWKRPFDSCNAPRRGVGRRRFFRVWPDARDGTRHV